MPYRLDAFSDVGLDEALLRLVIDEHAALRARLRTLWTYYRNPSEPVGMGRSPTLGRTLGPTWGQEIGLPARLTGRGPASPDGDDRIRARREIVIENDIAWRIQTMVDFMFGKPVLILSTARDAALRETIQRTLDAVWEASGGIALLQDMALLGHIYGHVDLVLRAGEATPRTADSAEAGADAVRIEVVEPCRGIPVLDPSDYRRILAYIIHFERALNRVDGADGVRRLLPARWLGAGRRARSAVTEVLSAAHAQVYDGERLIADGPNSLTPSVLPVVHIQNVSQPYRYEGLGEVEPLIPLQDELNTRLSDRASRVTLQSFKMYLAKGLDGFDKFPVGPGQLWTTDNMEASIQAFGGDAETPGEAAHIQEIREALDKVSGVPPLASGVVRAKIGNLTSANALRITLMGVLARTARKRVTYGRGIARMCELVLHALDAAGILATHPRDRGVRLVWPDPLPEDLREQVAAAKAKHDLGVPNERLLAELGYAPADAGVE